jgi:hypothetical protein
LAKDEPRGKGKRDLAEADTEAASAEAYSGPTLRRR